MISIRNSIRQFCYLAFATILIFSSCKKKELSPEEWGALASAKLKEIQALASNIPCSQKAKVSIQTLYNSCSVQYFAIVSTDLAKYEKLKKEYLAYAEKEYRAWTFQGLIVEPCFESVWAAEQPIRIDCLNDKVQLVTSANVSISEAKSIIEVTQEQLNTMLQAQTCTSEASWTFMPLVNYKTMKMDFVAYNRAVDFKALKEKISLYNTLNLRVIEAENNTANIQRSNQVDKIECVNGKPVIKYKN